MAEKNSDYSEDYFDRKDRQKRTRRVVLVVLLVLLLTVSFILYLEITGSRGGEFIDRITVSSYLKRNYGSELKNLKISYRGYNKARRRFEYDCSCEKGQFIMASKNFRVKFDGYYTDFLCDKAADEAILGYIRTYMDEKWPESGETAKLDIKLLMKVPLADHADVSDTAKLLEKYGSTMELEVNMYGKRLSFSEYKLCSYKMLDTIRGAMKVAPNYMQVFYFRDPEANETGPVMSYESELAGYMFNYNQGGYTKATDVNYIVELGETEKRSLKNYTIIRVVNFVVIGSVVIALATLFIVRRIKRKRKEAAALGRQ